MKLKLLVGLFIFTSLVIFPFSVHAFSLGDWFSSPIGILTRARERVEYVFSFSDGQKVQVLSKQAEKRLEKAREKAQTGDEESVKALVEDYKNVKEKQGKIVENMSNNDSIKNEIKNYTLNDQKDFKEIVENVSSDTAKQVIDSDRAVLSDIKNVVVVEGDEISEGEFEKSVSIIWAEGTGPEEVVSGSNGGEKNNVEVVGGLPQYAPGTSAGGESGREIEGGVKEVKENVKNEVIENEVKAEVVKEEK